MAQNMSKPSDRKNKQRQSDLSDGRNDYQRSPNKSIGSNVSSASRRKRRLNEDGQVREVTDSEDEESVVPKKQFDMLDEESAENNVAIMGGTMPAKSRMSEGKTYQSAPLS
jgi:hypothetical protein